MGKGGGATKSLPSSECWAGSIWLTTPQWSLPSCENSPWVAVLCGQPCVLTQESHPLPRCSQSASGSEWLQALPRRSPRQLKDRAQDILVSVKGLVFVVVVSCFLFFGFFFSHSALPISSVLSWTCATPRPCPGPLPLTPKLLVDFSNLLGKAQPVGIGQR